ncbi:hypothetical protein [Mycobacterium paraterrae]|uniref:Uncharacterized protein n=1 Tax=Mycobacterium paraterrae TaxID=577492 RepID=A0ABY3VIB4_9MYCO|nr:hypothetical protein [Mycobacterium paraterrae]UMB69147.1 hypothetical protein MKK62_22710 [Mycobacterium paraterrae]
MHVATFEIVDIDYDQTGFGGGQGVAEVRAQLPRTAKLTRRLAGPDRDDYFLAILENPIRYHPSPPFDWSRSPERFTATDDSGRFIWVYGIIIAALMTGTQIHAGMKNFAVNLAFVIDHTAGSDEMLDFGKCDSIGWATINDVDTKELGSSVSP